MEETLREMENMIEELTNELAENFYQTCQTLANITSIYDVYYEGSHTRFVSQKSAQVAESLGMTDTEIYEIKIAGLIHDIGKIGMEDEILGKFTSQMTGNEYQKYVMHPQIGMKLISNHPGFDNIGKIILQHHERIDGSGFPQHLEGKDINPQAAIISLIDSYHNAVFKKHKPGKPSPKYTSALQYLDSSQNRFSSTMNYIHQKSGILFDKTVVEAFTDIIEAERKVMGEKTVRRLPINKLKPGMIIAEDISTNYGLVLCYSGEEVTEDTIKSLRKTARWHEIPPKILVIT